LQYTREVIDLSQFEQYKGKFWAKLKDIVGNIHILLRHTYQANRYNWVAAINPVSANENKKQSETTKHMGNKLKKLIYIYINLKIEWEEQKGRVHPLVLW
jgi:hypothetical protein